MSWYLALPLATPFATAVIAFLLRRGPAGGWVAVAGSGLGVGFAALLFAQVRSNGVIVGQMGGWPAPYGITLAADLLSATMVLLTAIAGFAAMVYAQGEAEAPLPAFGYHAIGQLLLGGVTGAFLTGDLFNLYVWFEVMLIASFALLIMGGRPSQIDGAVKYVALNLVATVLFLSGIGLLYGVTGTLNMADLRGAVDASPQQGLLTVIAIFFLIAFAMKAAAFPLFSWLPASYHTPSHGVSAIFAALLSKVGVYALLRVFTLIFDNAVGYTHTILLWVAGLTMLSGVAAALAQRDLRRVLSFQVVSSIGFLIMGLALFSPLAIAGALFYMVHTVLLTPALFLIAGLAERRCGTAQLGHMGGLYAAAPPPPPLFFLAGFSLAGFPPLSGFWPKVLLVQAALDGRSYAIAAAALVAGLLTIWSIGITWSEVFWKSAPDDAAPSGSAASVAPMVSAVVGLTVLSLALGLFPQPVLSLGTAVANQLLEPAAYVAAVLGDAP